MAADDRTYLTYQYSDSEKYLVRVETHRDYSEAPGNFTSWVLDRLDPVPGEAVLDVGCGPGIYHRFLAPRGVPVVATDLFPGMLRAARERGGVAKAFVQATAERLPLRNGGFLRVMANHMLYHVEDQHGALREMHRVLRPRGRVVLATNAADNMRYLHEIHSRACEDVGLRSTSDDEPGRFTLNHLELVQSAFPSAQVQTRSDALVFTALDPLLRYYATFIIDYIDPLPPDGSHKNPLLGAMRERVASIIAKDGALRIPKDAGCFIADV